MKYLVKILNMESLQLQLFQISLIEKVNFVWDTGTHSGTYTYTYSYLWPYEYIVLLKNNE